MPLYSFVASRLRRSTYWLEFWSALALIAWAGINLISPVELSQKNFWPLLNMMPAYDWEVLFLLAGIVQIGSVGIDNRWGRAVTAALTSFLMASVVLNLLRANPWPPGGCAYYGAFAGANWMSMWKNIHPCRGRD